MSSCSKQKRATLVEWRRLQQPSHSEQGSSHGQYSDGPATQADQTLATATPPTTQSATAFAKATASLGRAGTFGHSLLSPSLCRRIHASDLLPLLRLGACRSAHDRQPHDPESAAHSWHPVAGTAFQLPPRLLQATLVAVAL